MFKKDTERLMVPIENAMADIEGLRVRILPAAFDKMVSFIQQCSGEVSGFGRVVEMSDGFLITDIIMLKQSGGAIETELSVKDIGLFFDTLITMKKEGKIANPMEWSHCWWHSHVEMPAYFSPTDDRTARNFIVGDQGGWLISIVGNKMNKFRVRFDHKDRQRHMIIPTPHGKGGDSLELEVAFGMTTDTVEVARKEIALLRKATPYEQFKPKLKQKGKGLMEFAASMVEMAVGGGGKSEVEIDVSEDDDEGKAASPSAPLPTVAAKTIEVTIKGEVKNEADGTAAVIKEEKAPAGPKRVTHD